MSSNKKSRSVRTLGVNESVLREKEIAGRKDVDPQGLLTRDAVRRHIEACTCPVCGAGPFKVLPMHTNQAHGIDKHELREMAGLTATDAISSQEFREGSRDRARARDLGPEHFQEMGRKRASLGSAVRYTTAGRRNMSENIKSYNESLTPEQKRARGEYVGAHVEGHRKQSEALRKKHQENPELGRQFRERVSAPEVEQKRREAVRAAAERKRLGHGTAASYKRGCRCDACREAKRQSRRATK